MSKSDLVFFFCFLFCFCRWPVFSQHEYLDRRTWGEGGVGSTDGEAAPQGWREDRKSESWGWSEGEAGMAAGDVWGRELGSRREGSTPETGGSQPLGGPLWYLPAPVGERRKAKYGFTEHENNIFKKLKRLRNVRLCAWILVPTNHARLEKCTLPLTALYTVE